MNRARYYYKRQFFIRISLGLISTLLLVSCEYSNNKSTSRVEVYTYPLFQWSELKSLKKLFIS
jgi:hypothetical protein